MQLSVIIVNYNVKYFLEQCLYSVKKAIKNIDAEIFVVDNNSVDGSCSMVRDKFPDVLLIDNKKNTGFSYANNQAIRKSHGEYVLLLNPDTVVEEDTFESIIEFMDAHPKAGGLGVKMIDGKGNFLPESKRGLPTPMTAFYKISGLSKLFPKSKTFGKYHMGYLDKDEINEVEILAGAFMLLRKKTLDEVGLLDEDYFMYGEDIDLSYRITKGGYKNYYFPKTTIIHYKGESTKKGSINYVMVFYKAMIIFAQKHFSKKNAKTFSALINTAIYLRAMLAILSRFFKNIFLPLLDASIIFLGFYIIKPYWEAYKFPGGGTYPDYYLLYVVPVYILIWILSVLFSGGYEKPIKLINIIKGIAAGSLIILIIYSMLSEQWRFSRALILIGSAWAFISTLISRLLLNVLNIKDFKLDLNQKKKIIIIGNQKEATRVLSLLNNTEVKHEFIGFVSPDKSINSSEYIGKVEQIKDIVEINKINEVVFCAKDITSQKIIKNMLQLSNVKVDYKIAPPESLSIIGSNSINTAGDFYEVNINSISKKSNIRNKRVFDLFVSVFFLLLSPVLIFTVKRKWNFIKNIFIVLIGEKSWVGYFLNSDINTTKLPVIKKGVLNPVDLHKNKSFTNNLIEKLNIVYAKDYKIYHDVFIIFRAWKCLGR
ncbi:MAG: glycosyl transferase family 2 [Bacteroidetes bacterium]|nr:MAG: glycosyl transferase family 2 [Bacteroidota bacterium]